MDAHVPKIEQRGPIYLHGNLMDNNFGKCIPRAHLSNSVSTKKLQCNIVFLIKIAENNNIVVQSKNRFSKYMLEGKVGWRNAQHFLLDLFGNPLTK